MSGGSYNYAFHRVEDFADELTAAMDRSRMPIRDGYPGDDELYPDRDTPSRRAFVAHLRLVVAAMRAIEWNDSGDGADEEAAIAAVLTRPP